MLFLKSENYRKIHFFEHWPWWISVGMWFTDLLQNRNCRTMPAERFSVKRESNAVICGRLFSISKVTKAEILHIAGGKVYWEGIVSRIAMARLVNLKNRLLKKLATLSSEVVLTGVKIYLNFTKGGSPFL